MRIVGGKEVVLSFANGLDVTVSPSLTGSDFLLIAHKHGDTTPIDIKTGANDNDIAVFAAAIAARETAEPRGS